MRSHENPRILRSATSASRSTWACVALALPLALYGTTGCEPTTGQDPIATEPRDTIPPTPQDETDASGIYSDDFDSCALDTGRWTLVDPRRDGEVTHVGGGTDDGEVQILAPAGVEHDPWTRGNRTVRLVQAAQDTDMGLEVKFESPVELAFQEQGLAIEQDASRFIRFEFYSDGADTHVFAASIDGSSVTMFGNINIGRADAPLYLRVERTGDHWEQSYSFDGASWTTAASFDHVIIVNQVGIYAGNEGSGGDIPAHTARVAYFQNLGSPSVPGDSSDSEPRLFTDVDGPGSIAVDPDRSVYACGERVTLTAKPDAGFSFVGWSGGLAGLENPAELVMVRDRSITAEFAVDGAAPIIAGVEIARGSTTAIVSWITDEPADSLVRYGRTSAYELGFVTDASLDLDHQLLVEGLASASTYHFELESADESGRTATDGDWEVPPSTGPQIRLFQGTEQAAGYGGIPQPEFNLLGNVSDSDGVASLTWSLNGGAEQPLALGPDKFRLHLAGEFIGEIPYASLLPGDNFIVLRAVDGVGNPSEEVVSLDFADAAAPDADVSIDFGSIDAIQDVAAVVTGDWGLTPEGMRVNSWAYDRLVAIGSLDWTDYEVTARLTIHFVEPFFESPSHGPALGFLTRWQGHTPDGRSPSRQWWPLGCFAHLRWRGDDTGFRSQRFTLLSDRAVVIDTSPGSHIQVDTEYFMKVSVETLPDGSSRHRLKMWATSEPEPVEWDTDAIEPTGEDVANGSLLIVAHHVDVTFHTLEVGPVSP